MRIWQGVSPQKRLSVKLGCQVSYEDMGCLVSFVEEGGWASSFVFFF